MALTIYTGDFALVADRRAAELAAGEATVAFPGLSEQALPETALLRPLSGAARVIWQSYDRDLPSPRTLIEASVGREVWLLRVNPATGEETSRRARLLAAREGIVVEVDGRIETDPAGRLAFDAIPEGVVRQPTLVAGLSAAQAGRQELELSYLTRGLGWSADYVARLDPGRDRLVLSGWATIANRTETAYPRARLSLVAGEIELATPPPEQRRDLTMRAAEFAEARPEEEGTTGQPVLGAHLYRIARPTTLEAGQTKQLALFAGREASVEPEYTVSADPHIFLRPMRDIEKSQARFGLKLENTEASGLGLPLPAGAVRVYESEGEALRFAGEARIGHTAVGETVELELGRAFDLPVERRQTSFNRIAPDLSESGYEVEIRNAKDRPVVVKVRENIPGDWRILDESHPHRKEAAHLAVWEVPVPAGGVATLRYRVRVRG